MQLQHGSIDVIDMTTSAEEKRNDHVTVTSSVHNADAMSVESLE